MWTLVKLVVGIACIAAFVWFGKTVHIGKHTLFGHFERIWKSEATQELVDSAKQEAGPAVDTVRRSVQAGVEEAVRDRARTEAERRLRAPADAGPTPTDAGPADAAPPAQPKHQAKPKTSRQPVAPAGAARGVE